MQFSYALVAAAAFAVAKAVIITNGPASFVGIQAGKALNISWADASGPVTLTLKNGEGNDLKTFSTIASGQTSGSYAWAIPSTLPVDFYAIEITDSTAKPNYSVMFEITGGPDASSSGSASSGSATTTGSSSSASATGASNSTITSTGSSSTRTGSATSSGSASRTASSATGTSTASAPPNSNSGASFASPLAFVLLAFAALITLN